MARPASDTSLPFPPYGSFLNFLNDLNLMGVLPNRLNQQVFAPSYSGSARNQIIRAFKFFGLANEDNSFNEERVSPLLNPDKRSAALSALLREKYQALIDLPLETAGPAEFNKWFADQGMDPASTRKAKSFFMAAAQENGIKMHSLVSDRVARRTSVGARKKRSRHRGEGDANTTGSNDGEGRLNTTGLDPALASLLERVPEFDTVPELEEWFKVYKTTFGYVKARTKNKAQAANA